MSKGKFVWHELMTSDVEAGKAFYSEVVGWKASKAPNMDYWMFMVGESRCAGAMKIPPKAAEMNVPPHWMAHIYVDDADAAAAKVTELGGTIHVPKQEIPGFGSFVIAADPQGAGFAMWSGEVSDKPDGAGTIGWNELNTTDYEAGWNFYRELFGWEPTESMDMGDGMGTYFMFKDAGSENSVGGMSNTAKLMSAPPFWMYYITVDDLDAAIERVKSNGGELLMGPMDVPGGDRVVNCKDPQGAAFSLHWRNPNPPA